jgi:hypothetical protein
MRAVESRDALVGLEIAASFDSVPFREQRMTSECLAALRNCATTLLAVAVIVGYASGPAGAQPADLTGLSLQELMKVDVISINVLGSHIHPAGQWMLGYEGMFEHMDGNRSGTRRVSHDRVLEQYATAPTDMMMQMHMAMGMYAPTNNLTLMAMIPYIRKTMNHVTRDGARFKETSEGIGDLQLKGLYTLYADARFRHRLILNGGVSVPTGSIDEQDFGPDRSLGRSRLEYPMQLGSGTVDLLPGVTYLGQTESWAWGAEFVPTVRLGRNPHHYTLGNRYRLSAWLGWKWTEWLGLSARLDGQLWENISGADRTLDTTDEPTKDPKAQGGRRLDALLGVNIYIPDGMLKGARLAVEAGAPLYQSLNGPQLQTDWIVHVGVQWAF